MIGNYASLRAELEAGFANTPAVASHSIAGGVLANRPVVVYGAGECSHWFFEIAMKMYGCKPTAVLDRRFAADAHWQGIPAFSPDDYMPDEETCRNGLVVVCIGNRALHGEIRDSLLKKGFQHVIPLHDIYEIHNPFGRPENGLDAGAGYFRENRERIIAAFDLLADDESRLVFLRFMQTHMHRRPVDIPQRARHEQYFPTDPPLFKGYARYVCCGAYDGDTVRLLHQTHGKVEAIACFEPELHIYSRLTKYLEQNASTLAEYVISWPCAVYGHGGQMPFLAGDGLGSRICENGEGVVQCVTLDQALAGFWPTFISMDVEGAEPEVLRGAATLIRKFAPDLGVCVYHSPAHVWEIPLLLSGLGVDYTFYLRNYTGFAIETVLYAINGRQD